MVLCMLGCNPRFWLIIRRLLTRTQTLEGPHMEGYDLPEFSKQFQKKKWCLDNLYWANRKVALTKPDWKLTFLIVVTVKKADPPATLFTMDLSQRKFPSSLAYMPSFQTQSPAQFDSSTFLARLSVAWENVSTNTHIAILTSRRGTVLATSRGSRVTQHPVAKCWDIPRCCGAFHVKATGMARSDSLIFFFQNWSTVPV